MSEVPFYQRSSQQRIHVSHEFPDKNNRTAILVVHGIGAQKPYATLDQFGRGLRNFFGPEKVKQQVCFRSQPSDPVTRSGEWVQAYLRLTPDDQPDDQPDCIVDVYEYYWAPVITDLVTARQSLRFLLFSALTPFQYLRDNLILMDQLTNKAAKKASAGQEHASEKPSRRNLQAETLPKDAESINKDSPKRTPAFTAMNTLLREFARMLFIFLPVIALTGVLYYLLGAPLIDVIRPHLGMQEGSISSSLLALFNHWPITKLEVVWLLLFGLRWLFILMISLFLLEEIPIGSRVSITRSPAGARTVMCALLLLLLAGHELRILYGALLAKTVGVIALLVVIGVAAFSAVFHDAFRRAIAFVLAHRVSSSPFDLISGKMFFYHANQNRRVERGVMPWTAHLSYWENPELYEFFGQLF